MEKALFISSCMTHEAILRVIPMFLKLLKSDNVINVSVLAQIPGFL